tara:strand:- start:41 stop:238 length:198 start_codon:yes stop_codon:yes gene_type:complete
MMSVQMITSLVTCLMLIGGIGWKLNSELSLIRLMIEKLMVKADEKWEQLEKLERRVEKLEDKPDD